MRVDGHTEGYNSAQFDLKCANGQTGKYKVDWNGEENWAFDGYRMDDDKLDKLEGEKDEVVTVRHRQAKGFQTYRDGKLQEGRVYIPLGELCWIDQTEGENHSFDIGFSIGWVLEDQEFWLIASEGQIQDQDYEEALEAPLVPPANRVHSLRSLDQTFSIAKLEGFSAIQGGNATVKLHILSGEGYRMHPVVRIDGRTQICPDDLRVPLDEATAESQDKKSV